MLGKDWPKWKAELTAAVGPEGFNGTRIEDGQTRDWASVLFRQGVSVQQAATIILEKSLVLP